METMKVLLVDDEAQYTATMQKRLSARGLEVKTAQSGEECLEMLDVYSADVVVLDVKMPGMDGIEALQEIKARHPLVEVIMLSGHASMEAAVEGMKLGAFHYLMKPADLNELMYKLEDAFSRKNMQERKIKAMKADTVDGPSPS